MRYFDIGRHVPSGNKRVAMADGTVKIFIVFYTENTAFVYKVFLCTIVSRESVTSLPFYKFHYLVIKISIVFFVPCFRVSCILLCCEIFMMLLGLWYIW